MIAVTIKDAIAPIPMIRFGVGGSTLKSDMMQYPSYTVLSALCLYYTIKWLCVKQIERNNQPIDVRLIVKYSLFICKIICLYMERLKYKQCLQTTGMYNK